ncbi:Molybdate transport system substrate-binding protein OS=Streptomyces griseomycini OX=66895 GN=FHS37_004086 PE=3 SV=1 [Streptomyces griseomycini]
MTRTPARRTLRIAGAGAAALLALSACSSTSGDATTGASGPPELSGTVTVFAAASLERRLKILGAEFERQRPGTEVSFNFGGSDSLAAGITNGAPADVFAAASPKTRVVVTDQDGTTAGRSPSSATSSRSPPCRATRTGSPPSRTSPSRA